MYAYPINIHVKKLLGGSEKAQLASKVQSILNTLRNSPFVQAVKSSILEILGKYIIFLLAKHLNNLHISVILLTWFTPYITLILIYVSDLMLLLMSHFQNVKTVIRFNHL